MNDTRMVFSLDNKEFILIGTAHVSRESINEVTEIIREEKPGLICVELDEGRYSSITQKESWENLNMIKVFKEGQGFLLMANLVLSGFQRRMGMELGVKPGEEMKTALDTAKELDIPYALCDREVKTTLRRAWANCGLWNKCKLLASLLASAFTTEKLSAREIEDLKKRSELDGMMEELASYLPAVKETLIDERDRYLAAKIWESAQKQFSANAGRVVAVVGAGHMKGIQTHMEKIAAQEETAEVAALDTIPPPGILSKIVHWAIPTLIIGLIVFGFFRAGTEMSLSMLLRWVLWNGSLSALGAAIALGHPLTILTSFLGAPFTSLSPVIGIGFLSGLVQVSLLKPRVLDAHSIVDDIGSLKGIYRNRISRALLVFFLSSLGSSIGTFISIPSIIAVLWAA